jgi:hypothetical protein
MKIQEFEQVLNRRLAQIHEVLQVKAFEYAQDGDRLYNFKVVARINNTTPEEALWGMAMKHVVSVIDLIEGRLERSEKKVDEKIGDLINYLILLEALFVEEREQAIAERETTHENETAKA